MPLARFLNQVQRLELVAADGDDEAPADAELLDQRRRHFGRRRGDGDGVVRRVLRPALIAVARRDGDVGDAEGVESLPRTPRERVHDL